MTFHFQDNMHIDFYWVYKIMNQKQLFIKKSNYFQKSLFWAVLKIQSLLYQKYGLSICTNQYILQQFKYSKSIKEFSSMIINHLSFILQMMIYLLPIKSFVDVIFLNLILIIFLSYNLQILLIFFVSSQKNQLKIIIQINFQVNINQFFSPQLSNPSLLQIKNCLRLFYFMFYSQRYYKIRINLLQFFK
ncbi:unnamed protein product [Paramecium sonneborni]|uniref:Transmembrane protein n=1 Tax=Paramecium sonneborni TaxID=65129 RepID=A0A8S1R7B2_9CILI|nr:unnamed protein product [Paramecium sonneborni]